MLLTKLEAMNSEKNWPLPRDIISIRIFEPRKAIGLRSKERWLKKRFGDCLMPWDE